ncbi:MAG: ribosomal protein S18-alanine N-acetyltransferase [Pyrinomonadaceae bacterium]
MSCAERVRVREPREFVIRTMTEHELIEVCEIEDSCRLSPWGWDAYYAELSRPESIMLVAGDEAGELAARACVDGFIVSRVAAGEMHVNNIGVRESARRRGVGGALLDRALTCAGRVGAREAVLEVRAGNEEAHALYRRFGFEVVGRRRHYYRRPTEDALIMIARIEVEG